MSISPGVRKIVGTLLLLLGVQLWLVVGRGLWERNVSVRLLVAALMIAVLCELVPLARRLNERLIDRLMRPNSQRSRRILTLTVAVAATLYLAATRFQQGLGTLPRIHDEFSYLIQTRMLLHGRLWEAQHPIADFFETFHFLVKPVYASKYFPGTALLYAPGLGLGLPWWMLPASVGGAAVAMAFNVITRLSSGRNLVGFLAVLILLGNSTLRRAACLYTSTMPMMLLGLAAIWALLHWREAPTSRSRARWAAALGALLSWAAITRPLDAVCFGLPIGVTMLVDLWRRRGAGHRNSVWRDPAIAVLAAIPLLSLQLVFDFGVTGRLLDTPWSCYTRASDPYDGMMVGADSSNAPSSQLIQKRIFSETFSRPNIVKQLADGRFVSAMRGALPAINDATLPHPFMLALLPIAALMWFDPRRAVLTIGLPLASAAYSLYTFGGGPYLVVMSPALALALLGGIDWLATTWPRRRAAIWTFSIITLAGLSVLQMPQFNRTMLDDPFRPSEFGEIDAALRALPDRPSVVLFHFNPELNTPHSEPVYNTDVAWPDDARIIRAHDLGERNVEIFRYYAARQPDRVFYHYDRGNGSIRFLGFASQLASAASTSAPVTQP